MLGNRARSRDLVLKSRIFICASRWAGRESSDRQSLAGEGLCAVSLGASGKNCNSAAAVVQLQSCSSEGRPGPSLALDTVQRLGWQSQSTDSP